MMRRRFAAAARRQPRSPGRARPGRARREAVGAGEGGFVGRLDGMVSLSFMHSDNELPATLRMVGRGTAGISRPPAEPRSARGGGSPGRRRGETVGSINGRSINQFAYIVRGSPLPTPMHGQPSEHPRRNHDVCGVGDRRRRIERGPSGRAEARAGRRPPHRLDALTRNSPGVRTRYRRVPRPTARRRRARRGRRRPRAERATTQRPSRPTPRGFPRPP